MAAFMLLLLILAVIAVIVMKAVYAAKLAEEAPEKYQEWRAAQEAAARQKQQILGRATISVVEMVKWWFKKKGDNDAQRN